MRVVVIGGTRFIGPAVVRALHTAGYDVTVFHRGETAAELPEAVTRIHGDRAELPHFRDCFADLRPEVAIDMIAMTEADAHATVDTFRGLAGRLVVLSSGDVYRAYDVLRGRAEPVEPMPLTEEAALRSRLYPYDSDYDKILVERAVLNCPELPATVLRLPMVYGPADYQHRLRHYVCRMRDGRPVIPVEADLLGWRVTRGYVDDVAAAIAAAAGDPRAAGRTYNVGEATARTEAQWIAAAARITGWSGEVMPVPAGVLPEPLRSDLHSAQDLIMDSSAIRRELGFVEPSTAEEAMAATVEWELGAAAGLDLTDEYAAEDAVLRVVSRPH